MDFNALNNGDVANQISLEIDAAELHKEIGKKLDLNLPTYTGDRITKIAAPYGTYRSKKGAIIISSDDEQPELFNLRPQELKTLVRGIVWRDEHFNGKTLRDIAKQTGLSEGYIGKCIFQSFDILKAQLAKAA